MLALASFFPACQAKLFEAEKGHYAFLFAAGAYVFHLSANKRGEVTELTLELNRPELIERRKERIDLIRLLADRIVGEVNQNLKKLLIKEVQKEIADDKPYAMTTRAMFEALPN